MYEADKLKISSPQPQRPRLMSVEMWYFVIGNFVLLPLCVCLVFVPYFASVSYFHSMFTTMLLRERERERERERDV